MALVKPAARTAEPEVSLELVRNQLPPSVPVSLRIQAGEASRDALTLDLQRADHPDKAAIAIVREFFYKNIVIYSPYTAKARPAQFKTVVVYQEQRAGCPICRTTLAHCELCSILQVLFGILEACSSANSNIMTPTTIQTVKDLVFGQWMVRFLRRVPVAHRRLFDPKHPEQLCIESYCGGGSASAEYTDEAMKFQEDRVAGNHKMIAPAIQARDRLYDFAQILRVGQSRKAKSMIRLAEKLKLEEEEEKKTQKKSDKKQEKPEEKKTKRKKKKSDPKNQPTADDEETVQEATAEGEGAAVAPPRPDDAAEMLLEKPPAPLPSPPQSTPQQPALLTTVLVHDSSTFETKHLAADAASLRLPVPTPAPSSSSSLSPLQTALYTARDRVPSKSFLDVYVPMVVLPAGETKASAQSALAKEVEKEVEYYVHHPHFVKVEEFLRLSGDEVARANELFRNAQPEQLMVAFKGVMQLKHAHDQKTWFLRILVAEALDACYCKYKADHPKSTLKDWQTKALNDFGCSVTDIKSAGAVARLAQLVPQIRYLDERRFTWTNFLKMITTMHTLLFDMRKNQPALFGRLWEY